MARRTVQSTTLTAAQLDAHCKGCGYALKGLTSRRCPECGREFDLSNQRTFSHRRPRGAVWRWAWRAIGAITLTVVLAGTGFGLLRRGWNQEQNEIHRLGGPGNGINPLLFEPIGPPILHRMLGGRFGYLCDRLIDLNLDLVNDERLLDVHFDSFAHLKKLSVAHFRLRDRGLDHLGEATQVEELAFEYGDFRGRNLGFLARMSALRHLRINVDDSGLSFVSGLEQLQSLNLDASSSVTDPGLEHLRGLKALQELYLHGTNVTDAGLEHLKGLKSLRVLDVHGTRITNAGLDKLKKAIPGLVVR